MCIGCLKHANTNKKVAYQWTGGEREANQIKNLHKAKSSWLNQP